MTNNPKILHLSNMNWTREKTLAFIKKLKDDNSIKSLRQIAVRSGVGYNNLFAFWQGRSHMLSVGNLNKIIKTFAPDEKVIEESSATIDIVGAVDEAGKVTIYDHTARGEKLKQVPCPTGYDADTTKALLVTQDILSTIINAGSLIYYTTDPAAPIHPAQDVWQVPYEALDDATRDDPFAAVLKRLCVLRVKGGGMMFCRLMRGYSKNHYNLKLFNGKDIEDAQIEWAARVISITM